MSQDNELPVLNRRVVEFVGPGVPGEIEYTNESGELVGYWAYGNYDPSYPYQGQAGFKVKLPELSYYLGQSYLGQSNA